MKQIDAYRSRHVIAAVKDWDDDLHGFTMRCKTDLMRVHPTRDGGWYHDPGEVRQAALMGTVMPMNYDPIDEAKTVLRETEEVLRLLRDDVEAANRWTEDELVMIANQSGIEVRRA